MTAPVPDLWISPQPKLLTLPWIGSTKAFTHKIHRLEAQVRECLANGDHERIEKIVHQLCHDFAYAIHQPHARNGGLIGLAAASIALGSVLALLCSII
jgi:hypothetical protein